jgi:plasmid stabilization system protein ParE
MSQFRLSRKALEDVAEIITYQHRHKNPSVANETESRLLGVFSEIAESPVMGHRRTDLTSKNVMFHYEDPYFILFRRMRDRTQVFRVAHKSRDLRKFV